MSKEVDISGLKLEWPVMNGAGPVKLKEHVLEVAQSDSAAVVLGSITIEERAKNSGRTYHPDGLNSRGLPNPGSEFYRQVLPEMVKIAHDYGKPLIVSSAGFSPEEYAVLAEIILSSDADGQELNLGCPNVWGKDGKQKRITSFDEELTASTLEKVEERVGRDFWTSIKLSPYSDPVVLEAMSQIISRFEIVKAVTAINTFPNAFMFDGEGNPAIDPAGGLGGLSGRRLKPIGLGQVKQLRAVLPDSIVIIGVGGIESGKDVEDYLRVEASATQITTAYINFGPSIFKKIKDEMKSTNNPRG